MSNHEPNPDDFLPLVEAAGEQAMAESFPDGGGPTPETPLGAAMLWWLGLADPAHYRNVLDNLSDNPAAWGDYSEAAECISGLSIMQFPIFSEDRPDDLAYIKFIDFAGDSAAQALATAPLNDVWILTMVKDGAWWFVWGMSHNYLPPASEVYRA